MNSVQSSSHRVYLALGANLGDRRAHLVAALERLGNRVELEAISSIYETEPVGYLDQPRFFNLVCAGRTALAPLELLAYTQTIQVELGRQPSFRNAPRPIDIDILLYDDLIIEGEALTLPHPRMQGRAFVLIPFAEIAPDVVDPRSELTIHELAQRVSTAGVTLVGHLS